MAAAHIPREAVRSAAEAACRALSGSFAAVSVWERELGRLRVLVNSGELAAGEEEFPEHEFYPVHEFPEITEFLHEEWARGGEPHAWVEVAAGPDGDGWGPGPGPGRDTDTGTGTDAVGGLRGALRGVSPGRVAALRRRGRGSCVV
ncbi:diguanylate cyclase, partial [Streptomyces sp. 2MCAF27]